MRFDVDLVGYGDLEAHQIREGIRAFAAACPEEGQGETGQEAEADGVQKSPQRRPNLVGGAQAVLEARQLAGSAPLTEARGARSGQTVRRESVQTEEETGYYKSLVHSC